MSNGMVPRQRSFAGPIVLILVGLVFLLRNLHILGWNFGYLFAKYWPALLILWGVIKLIEYQQAKSAGMPPPGIGAGGVFLLIFLVMFGLSARKFYDLRDSGMFHFDREDLPDFLQGETFTFDDQVEQAFAAGSTLRITNDHGNINLNAADGDRIKVMVRKTVHADNQEEADGYNQQTKPQITVVDKTVTLNANTGGGGNHGVSVDLDVYVPRKVAVALRSAHGDVSIMGRDGDLEVSSQHGEVSLQDVTGNAKLDIERSNVRVSKLVGDLAIDGRVNEVNVSDIKGTARLTGEFYDNVTLARITKSVTFKTSRTDLEFSGIEGTLDLDGGDLHGNSVAGPVRLLTKEKDIRLDGVNGDVRVSNNDGTVEIKVGKLPVGNIDIINRNADVQVYLPDQAGFKLDASTDNGEVQSGFSELKVSNDDDKGRATGTVGNGAGSIRITNAHGGIEIRKGSSAPKPPSPPRTPGSDDGSDDDDKPKEGVRDF
jgi:Putative adhesin/Domain of unknown function (DUF5668)